MSRIGPRMRDVAAYVAAYPGLAMLASARYVAPHGTGIGYGYRTVHRALAAGLVIGVPGPRGSTRLYPAPAAVWS